MFTRSLDLFPLAKGKLSVCRETSPRCNDCEQCGPLVTITAVFVFDDVRAEAGIDWALLLASINETQSS